MSLYLTFMVNVCQFLHSPLMVTFMASEFVPFFTLIFIVCACHMVSTFMDILYIPWF